MVYSSVAEVLYVGSTIKRNVFQKNHMTDMVQVYSMLEKLEDGTIRSITVLGASFNDLHILICELLHITENLMHFLKSVLEIIV